MFIVLPDLSSAGAGILLIVRKFIYPRTQILAIINLFLQVLGDHWISKPQVSTEWSAAVKKLSGVSKFLDGGLGGFNSVPAAAELGKSSLNPKL